MKKYYIMKQIGLLLGSFNPIHNGHLIIANYCLENWGLDEILFVVAKNNPFKDKNSLVSFEDRVKMCELAIEGEKRMNVETIENTLEPPFYTIKTLNALKEKYTDVIFHIIIGLDNWLMFDKWNSYKTLIKENHIIVLPRYNNEEDNKQFIKKKNELMDNENIKDIRYDIFNNTHFSRYSIVCNISSTMIREMIRNNKTTIGFIPKNVSEFIIEKNIFNV